MQDERADSQSASGARQGVQAIARAGAVLRALEAKPEGLGLGELAIAVGLPKSTIHRLVGALATEELVSTAGPKITLGGGLVRLAAARRHTLARDLHTLLGKLRDELEETIDLAVLDGNEMRFVDQLPAAHRLRAVSSIGVSFPLHCTANGKALLATLPEDRLSTMLDARLRRMTPNTIVSRAALLKELERIRHRGVAFDHEEHTEGICAAGVAVLDPDGPVGAISVPVPTPRFRGNERRYAQALTAAAREAVGLLRRGG